MLLHYLSHLVMQKENHEENKTVPRRMIWYRGGQEYCLEDKDGKDHDNKPHYFGDLVTILGPGIYTFHHRNRKVLVSISQEGLHLLKEYFFIQLHWFQNGLGAPDTEALSLLLSDAKEFFPFQADGDGKGLLTVYRYSNNTLWEQLKTIPQRSMTSMHLPKDLKRSVLGEIENFLSQKHQQQLKHLELPRKLAFLFSSERGGGKTNFIHAILGHFKLNKGVLPLEEIDNDLLCLSSLPNRTAIVIENVDTIEGNDEDSAILTNLQTLLDGRECHQPLLLFLTCTDHEKLKEPVRKVLKTCKRIDQTKTLGAPGKSEIKKMFERFYPDQKNNFGAFYKLIGKLPLPNLSLLENFFRQHLDNPDMTTVETNELQDMIKDHKNNIKFQSGMIE
jgi:hypothetical protein